MICARPGCTGVVPRQLNSLGGPLRRRYCSKKCARAHYHFLKDSGARVPVRRGTGNPLTTDRIYDDDEREFMVAMDRLRRTLGRHPTWPEVLGAARGAGYARVEAPTQGARYGQGRAGEVDGRRAG